MKEQRKEILMTGRPPAHRKQKSAQMEGCGQRHGAESAEGEERAKEDGRGGGGAGGTGMMPNLCLTITRKRNYAERTTEANNKRQRSISVATIFMKGSFAYPLMVS